MAKKELNIHVLAVKDYNALMKELKEVTAVIPGVNLEIMKNILPTPYFMVSELKGLRKFIKKVKASKKEVGHYWEGLVFDGYSLVAVEYEDERTLMTSCDGEKIKFII